jgi:hypothetical protein
MVDREGGEGGDGVMEATSLCDDSDMGGGEKEAIQIRSGIQASFLISRRWYSRSSGTHSWFNRGLS